MFVTKLFLVGKVTVLSSWIALIFAFIAAYVAVRKRFGKQCADVLLDGVFYFVLVWKLSVLITDFNIVIKWPLSIIYFHGGRTGVYLGLLAACVVVYRSVKKKRLRKEAQLGLFFGVVLIQAVYQVLMALMNDNPLAAEWITVILFAVFALFVWVVIKRPDSSLIQLALLFMAMHVFVASFQPAGVMDTAVGATGLISLFFILLQVKGRHADIEAEDPL